MATLKEVFAGKMVPMRERIQKILKEHGEMKIADCTIAQAYGGMRSVKSMVWEVSALDPNEVQRLVRDVSKSMEQVSQRGQVPVLLTTPELRRHVRRLLGRFLPGLSVLSYNEISPDTRILAINR